MKEIQMKCIFCGIKLKEKIGKIYVTDKHGNTVMIEDHRYACPRCGWWIDGEWEVYESDTTTRGVKG